MMLTDTPPENYDPVSLLHSKSEKVPQKCLCSFSVVFENGIPIPKFQASICGCTEPGLCWTCSKTRKIVFLTRSFKFSISEYLQDLSEVLLFLLLPLEDFQNKPFRYIIRVSVELLLYCKPAEPPHGKTNNLHRQKQRRRSASQ